MKFYMIYFLTFAIFFTVFGYYIDKFLGGCGIAICATFVIIAILYDIKDAIVKVIKEGSKTDE